MSNHPGGRASGGEERHAGSSRGETLTLATLGLIGLITAAWWALALWPVPGETPQWLARARTVCFNATETGLPDVSGWILLIGQPLGMVALLVAGWGRPLRSGLGRLAGSGRGRTLLASACVLVVTGLGAAGVRVARASEAVAFRPPDASLPGPDYPRLDRAAPDRALVDQHGERVSLDAYRGRPVMVTFAFGHCSTVCPVVVRQVLAARDELRRARGGPGKGSPAGPSALAVVVISLDPWRDTPARLPHLAEKYELEAGDRVLSGSVDEVEATLDAWNVPRSRDLTTGDIVHPALVYLVDASGTIAYATKGGVEALVELARRTVSPTEGHGGRDRAPVADGAEPTGLSPDP